MIEAAIVEIDGELLILHSHVNTKGKVVLNKEEAALLLIELYKFINEPSTTN